jgi:AraC-like DNA-binding protein
MPVHSSGLHDEQAADPLSAVLQDLRPARATYCRSELTRPWGVHLPRQDGVRFHFVAEGGCWLRPAAQDNEREPVWLAAGDAVLLPHGTAHVIADEPGTPARDIDELAPEPLGAATYRLRTGGGGARSLVVCCTVAFDEPAVHPLLQSMPEVLLVRRADASDPALMLLLSLMADETGAQRMGSATVMARLADTVITHVVRAWVEAHTVAMNVPKLDSPDTRDGPDRTELRGWLTAIRDPRIAKALAAMHRRPGHVWPVEVLASIAGMSRSSFAGRFKALVGMSPAHYLAQWRMHVASASLRSGRHTVAKVAEQLGYASEASFSRAFKGRLGVAPGTLRRRKR